MKNSITNRLLNVFTLIILSITMFLPKGFNSNPVLAKISSPAQTRTVEGNVEASDSGPLPGVNVTAKGTSVGTVTDVNGYYSLDVPADANTLVFSFVGYQKKEVTIGDQSEIDVTLQSGSRELSEVVVTALGVEREERSLGYAVQDVSTEGIAEARETNIVNSLSGKIAGVNISNGSGSTLGGSSRITIRGINSISGNNQPLFVVDGTPIDNSNYSDEDQVSGNGGRDYGNAAQDINPDDIKSINVLKGPAASALYGNRASNGVILITTKSGSSQEGIGVSFNSTYTQTRAARLPQMQNEYGGGFKRTFDEYTNENGETFKIVNTNANNSWGPRFEGQMVRHWDSMYPGEPNYEEVRPWEPTPNNIRDFLETGHIFSNNVSLSGGNDAATFRLSYTNLDQSGIMPNSSLKRDNLNLSASADLTEKLTASAKINYVDSRGFGRPSTGDWSAQKPVNVMTYWYAWTQRQIDPARLINYKSDRYRHMTWNVRGPESYDQQSYNNNPYFTLYENYNNDERKRMFGNVSLSYELSDHLKISGFLRSDFYTDRREDRAAKGGYLMNSYQEEIIQFREDNYEFLAQYDKNIGDDYSISANLGANSRQSYFGRNFARTQGGLSVPNFYNLRASVGRLEVDDQTIERTVNSIYGSASLGYKGTYYLDASLRNDWSSTLPVGNNSYLYPALSASFVFTELLPYSDLLSFGKIRAGWAQVGNDTDPYRLDLTYKGLQPFGDQPAYTVPNSLNNSNLQPELTTNYEIGLDTRFLNGRIGMDITYYQNVTRNQIVPLTISSTTGFQSAIVNAGEMENKGVEFMLKGTPIERESGLVWDVSFNWAKNQNKVVELAEGQNNYELGSRDDVSINARIGQPYGTIVGADVKRNEEGEMLVDNNGRYIREPGKVLGNILPDFTGGLSNSFALNGFKLSAIIDFQQGGDVYTETIRNGIANGQFIESVGLNSRGVRKRAPLEDGGGIKADAVTESGAPNEVYVEAQQYHQQYDNLPGLFVFDRSYIKLREVRMGYALPKKLYENIPVQSISLSLVGRDLGLIYAKMPHLDPSALAVSTSNIQGLEGASLPPTRSFGLNLKIKL